MTSEQQELKRRGEPSFRSLDNWHRQSFYETQPELFTSTPLFGITYKHEGEQSNTPTIGIYNSFKAPISKEDKENQ